MKRWMGLVLAMLAPVSTGAVMGGGCGDAALEDEESLVSQSDELWGRRSYPRFRRPSTAPTPPAEPGGMAGTGGQAPGSATGCDICVKAKSCCDVVTNRGPLCTHDAGYCAGLDEVRREAYINACKTLIATTFQAWQSRGMTPPPSCL